MSIQATAAKAGVSIATVSRVINGNGKVSEETAQRVMQAMHEIGYQPRPVLLRRGRKTSNPPGLLHGNIALLWTAGVRAALSATGIGLMDGATRAAASHGLSLIVDYLSDPNRIPPIVQAGKVDGILLQGPEPNEFISSKLREFPVVWMFYSGADDWGDRVQPDHERVGRLAAEYLLRQGHTHLTCVTYPANYAQHSFWTIRADAFRKFGTLGGAAVDVLEASNDAQTLVGDFAEAADDVVRRVLQLSPRPTCLFVANSNMGIPIYHALSRQGIRPMKDMILISGDQEELLNSGLDPRPVTVDIRATMIGQYAVEQLLWRLQHKDQPARICSLVEPMLVEPLGIG
ncbi:TPA: hypothetical protein DDW35_09845 [Candidatus Sumerlaeota bacterium]|jgi:LacI family transcriptional regulator|nr:hypothetical protein [Candidatus Sumerlaeota bacterium]